ncbi:MAG: chloride channel protein [Ardenticatenaceae bacterium]|nr:chloride channel protein [Ardenticatenaceae bacterium]
MPSAHGEPTPVNSNPLVRALQQMAARLDVQSTAVLMAVAIVVGFGTGLSAVIFIKAIDWVTRFAFERELPHLLGLLGPAWIVLVPVIGGLIVGPMIAYWAVEAKGHGVPEVMQAIIMQGGRIRPRVAVVKSLASAVAIGTGASAGREGPIVQVGAALGSTAAQFMRLRTEQAVTLVACGAAAGIAATFNAPIAGVIFAMEVILGEFTTHYFGMVVVAAVAASVVSRHFLGVNPAFVVPSYTLVSPWELPLYAVLGVLSALTGWAFVGVLYFLEDRFDFWRFPEALKPAVGAVVVGVIGLLYPQVFGTGLSTIGRALAGALPWTLLLILVIAKLLATAFTLGSGSSGGIFSPSLFMGAMLGGSFGHWAHALFPAVTASNGAYALVGMASVFAASAHAPLTAFLIVFEMSGDYRMILPLMITVGLSTLLSQNLRRYSIYTFKLVKRGIPLERDRDVDVMRGLTVGEVMTQNPDVVRAEMSLEELAATFVRTHHHGFPVLDREGHFLGVVTVQDLERAAALGPIVGRTVADITKRDVVTALPNDPLSKALRYMSDRDVGRIPVVDPDDPTQLVGLLRRQNIVRAYSHAILRKLETQHRKQSLRLGHLTDTEILEISLSGEMAAVGRRIKDLALPRQALITSIRREHQVLIPHGETLLQAGDTMVMLTRQDTADAVRQALAGGAANREPLPELEGPQQET